MRKIREIIRYIVPVLIITAVITASCSGRKSKADNRGIIPENVLTEILTDLFLTDGLLTLPKVRHLASGRDSIETHMEVIEKYSYSVHDLDKTLKYYFIKRPKKLIRIFDRVLGKLSEMELIVMNEVSDIRTMLEDIWPGKENYLLPDPLTRTDTAELNLHINAIGPFSLIFDLRIYPDDQTLSPKSGLWLYYPDNPDSLQRQDLNILCYIKDGRAHKYNIPIYITGTSAAYLRGWFVDHDNQHPGVEKHINVENILLRGSRIQ